MCFAKIRGEFNAEEVCWNNRIAVHFYWMYSFCRKGAFCKSKG